MELWTAFLLGLAGSLHCAGMCGPLVLALAKARRRTGRESTGRVFYHLGRVVSYGLLGLVLGLFGYVAVPAGFQRWLSILLGVLLLGGLAPVTVPLAAPVMKWVLRLRTSMGNLFQRDSLAAQALMGALNGLLPCGLVYVAAVGAIATGHPAAGGGYMACFGLGTLPLMLGLHFAGQRFALSVRFSWNGITRAAVLSMAVLLILRGLEIGIPFVSPEFSTTASGDSSCH